MGNQVDKKYYVSRKSELLEEFDKNAQYWRQVIVSQYGDDFANTIVRESRVEYEALIPEIPYIGGDENHLTGSLIESAECLALYKAMKARGKTAEETGKILYDTIEVRSRCPSPPIRPSKRLSREELMRRRRERAEKSQKRRYPGDWVYGFVEGDGREFDYGYDFSECGTRKFYHAQGADEFLAFCCFLDFPKS